MACTDQDDVWTCAPGCKVDTPVRNHVRMMSFAGEPSSEIILDSGADTKSLPLSFANVGESCSHDVEITLMHKVASLTSKTHVLQLWTWEMV